MEFFFHLKKLSMVIAVMLPVLPVPAALTAYEGFYATANISPSGFSDASSLGLSGTWSTLQNQGMIQSRTTDTHWDAAAANLSAHSIGYPIKNSGYYNFVENNNNAVGQFQISLASSVNLASGTNYMSFTISSGSSDCYAEAGLANSSSGNELMWGEGWNPGVGIHYCPSSGFNPNSYRATQTGPGLSNWDVWLYVAQLSQSGGTVTMNLYCYDLNSATSLPLDVSTATPFWTTTLSSVTDTTFDKLEFEVAGYNGNYPSVGQIRLGTTWAGVMGMAVSSASQVWNGGGTNNNWSNGSNWVSTVSPAVGDYVTFASTTQAMVNLDTNAYVGSLTFSNNASSFNITNSSNTLTLGGGLTNNSSNAQTLAVTVALSGSQTVNAAVGNVTISGAVSGSSGLTFVGGGQTTLSGVNSYTGNTAIQGGTLVLSNPSAATYSGAITGSGTLVKSGAGTLILSGANNFTGMTTVSNGAVFIQAMAGLNYSTAGNQSLGTNITVVDGATLGITASSDTNYLSPASLTVGGSTGATLQFGVVGTNCAILKPTALTLNGTTTINISGAPYMTNVNFPLLTGYTAGTLVLGAQPTGWSGKLVVSGVTVYYMVTNLNPLYKPFVHPGALSTLSDFARMKAKVQAGAHPWIDDWNMLVVNGNVIASEGLAVNTNGYKGTPWPHAVRGGSGAAAPCNFDTYQWLMTDAAWAYQCSVMWQVTGSAPYAETAMGILTNWSCVCTQACGDPNAQLMDFNAYQMICAAENIRNYTNFTPANLGLVQNWLTNVWYPSFCVSFLNAHDGTCPTYIYGNWDLGAMALEIGMGVLCDRRDIYNSAINYYTNYQSWSGAGQAYNLMTQLHPGYFGQSQEMGRDQGHATLDPVTLSVFCEIAWNQGDDMYGFNSNECLAISEYTSKYNEGYDNLPFANYINCVPSIFTGIGWGGRYMFRPGYEMIWNHYENRKGLSAPYTKAMALGGRPEGGGGNYGTASGGFDQLGFTTLTHVLDAMTNPPAPSGLSALVNNRAATLSWWGTANATSYNVKRSTNNGATYTTIASGMGAEHFYTDVGLLPGTNYNYVVSAMVNGTETTNSLPVLVTANQLLTGTWIGSPGSWNNNGTIGSFTFDNSMSSYYDAANTSGDWTGLDLGVNNVITGVAYCPRPGNSSRMVGGQFQGCNVPDFSSGVVTLFTPSVAPTDTMPPQMTYQAISNPNAFRYVRYIGPNGAACDVAEIQFYGYVSGPTAPLAPTGISTLAGPLQVTVSWTPSAGASSFNVGRSLTSGGPYTLVGSNVMAATYTDTGLTSGTTYYYVISAINANGQGASSVEVSGTPYYAPTANVTWSGDFTGTWDTTTMNWQTNLIITTYHDGNSVLFDDSASFNTTVSLATSYSPAAVAFNNNSKTYYIGGSSINGSGSLIKANGGTVYMQSANNFTGGATISGGTLTIQTPTSLGSGVVTLNGGTLNSWGGGVGTFANNIVVAGGSNAIQLGSANNLTVSGTISGNGSLTLGNDGDANSLYLSGANTMTGGSVTVANNANSVRFSNASVGNGNADWVFNNATAGRTTFEFASGTIAFGSVSGNGIIQGNYGGSMNVTMLVGGDNNSTVFSGIIHDNKNGSGTIGLTKTGTGTQWLTGACDYSGTTTVTNGQLVVSTVFASKGSCWVTNSAVFGVTNLSSGSGKISNLTLAAGTALVFLNVTSSTTPLLSASNVVVGGACAVKITQTNGIALGTYPLVNYSGNFQGSFANLQLQLPAGVTGTLVSNANQITLSVTAIPPPSAPAILTAVAGNAQVALNWSASVYASGYNVWRSLTGGSGYSFIGSASGTSYADTGLANNQAYYYVVTATNIFGTSGNSPEASATPRLYAFWTGATNANWDFTTTNWLVNAAAGVYQNSAIAVFNDTALSNVTINVATPVSPIMMVVSNYIQSYSFVGNAITGTGSLIKAGSYPLTLSGANTYSGGTTNYFGAIVVAASSTGSPGSLTSGPLGTGPVTVSGGNLSGDASSRTLANAVVAAAGTTSFLGSSSAGQNFTLAGAFSGSGALQNDSASPVNSYSLKFQGDLSGYTGTMIYNGVSSGNGANWRIGISGSTVDLSQAALVLNGGNGKNFGYLDGASSIILKVGSLSGNGYFQGAYNGGNGCVLSIGFLNTNSTFIGQVGVSGNNMANFSVTKVGTGTQWLTGPNIYTGQTTVSNGELVVSTVFAGNGDFWVTNGATLGVTNLSATSAAISSLIAASGTSLEFMNVSSTVTSPVSVGSVTLGSSCKIKITGANDLAAGNTYPLIKYTGSFTGDLTNVQLQMPYGWRGTLVNSGNQISLANVAIVSTTPPQMGVMPGNQQLQLSWPFTNTGWRLLMSTNLSSANWTDVSSNLVMATNQIAVPVTSTNSSVFYRLVYP